MPLKTYDPKKVVVTLGPSFITGYAKDTFLKAGRVSDSVTDEAGATGEVCRSINNDTRGQIELTLIQSSQSNDFLSALEILDKNTGAGFVPLLIQDLKGTTIYAAKNAWVQKPADGEFAQAVGDRKWIIRTDDLEVFVGGIAPAN